MTTTTDRLTNLRGTLALIASGRGPAPQMASTALEADDQQPDMRAALLAILKWYPESVPMLDDPPCTECGWQEGDHEAQRDHSFTAGPPAGVPFFTEAFLYDLLGKEDARSLLYLMRDIARAAGFDPRVLEGEAQR